MTRRGAVSTKPHMMKIWDFAKNALDPDETPARSAELAWWKCPTCGHSWQSSIRGKKNSNCPVCNGSSRIIPGHTDFRTACPEIGQDALDELNPDIDLNTLGVGSHTRINWKCHVCGYEWSAPVYGRCSRLSKCPACAKQVRIKTFDEEYPELIPLYSEKNSQKLSDLDGRAWQQKFIWECEKHGSFEAPISSQVRAIKSGNTGCPYCHGTKVKREDSVGYLHPELLEEWDDDRDPFTISCYSKQEINWKCDKGHKWTAIVEVRSNGYGYCRVCYPRGKEYTAFTEFFPDIEQYYSDKNDTELKDCINTDTTPRIWVCEKGHEFTDSCYNIYTRGKFSCLVCNHRIIQPGVNDFATEYPDYAKDLVGDAKTVSPITNDQMTFKCSQGHTFQRSPRIHIERKGVCPICNKKVFQKGVNDLLTLNPRIKDIWDYDMNELGPDEYYDSDTRRFCFVCDKGHSYKSNMGDLKNHDYRCPICNNFSYEKKTPITETNPELIMEWSDSNERGPETYEKTESYRAFWICPTCGGEYRAPIRDRGIGDDSCPYCSNRRVLAGFNDLTTTHPELAKEWSVNNSREADEFFSDSAYTALWVCPTCNGEYEASIRDRKVGDDSCPYCRNVSVLSGFNDLATTNPELAKEWSANDTRKASEFLKNSSYIALWVCPNCEGEYKASIRDREVGDDSCPYCNNKKVLPGFNDFATLHPSLMKEWSVNNSRRSDEFFSDSAYTALWVCPNCNGEYEASIRDRKVGDDSCPYCRNVSVLPGFNDLATTNPELAKEWSANDTRKASEFLKNSSYIALWVCPNCEGEYKASIRDREVGDNSCPYCNNKKVLPGFNDFATLHPSLMKEWMQTENTFLRLNPSNLKETSTETAWWECPICGYMYKTTIANRVIKEKRGHNACPYCNGRRQIRKHFFK